MTRLTASLACVAALLLGGCDRVAPSVPSDPMGVALQDGDVTVLLPACVDRGPNGVQLLEVPEDDPDDPGEVVWEVEATADEAPRTESFTVGATPDGYRETTALAEPLDADQLYTAKVDAGDSIQLTFVVSEDLGEDTILQDGTPVTPDEFEASTACTGDEGEG